MPVYLGSLSTVINTQHTSYSGRSKRSRAEERRGEERKGEKRREGKRGEERIGERRGGEERREGRKGEQRRGEERESDRKMKRPLHFDLFGHEVLKHPLHVRLAGIATELGVPPLTNAFNLRYLTDMHLCSTRACTRTRHVRTRVQAGM